MIGLPAALSFCRIASLNDPYNRQAVSFTTLSFTDSLSKRESGITKTKNPNFDRKSSHAQLGHTTPKDLEHELQTIEAGIITIWISDRQPPHPANFC